MNIIPTITGRVRFIDKLRGYGIADTCEDPSRTVLVLSRMMRDYDGHFLPGMSCVLADVYQGPKGLVASRIVSAQQDDERLAGWQPVTGRFYHLKDDYAFAEWNGRDVYVPGVLWRHLQVDARVYPGMKLEALIYLDRRGYAADQIRKVTT